MICFCWVQLPQYAARCIGAFARMSSEEVVVFATKPRVPIEGMERCIPGGVVWIDEAESRTLLEICQKKPRAFFVSGWATPLFNRYRDEVHKDGGKVFALSDNNFIFSIEECIKSIRFRCFVRSKYDGYFVPGLSGEKLLRFYGVKKKLIAKGVYAADGSLFHDGKPLKQRPKRMIFVGRLTEVKNVLRLCAAFRMSQGAANGWTLDIYGCGESRSLLKDGDGISIHDFLQPEGLAEEYRQSRVFILPSIKEHWGLVVHEAALSGCVLLLSNCIGAKDDMLGKRNGFTFNPWKVNDIASAMHKAYSMSDDDLLIAHDESLEMAKNASIDKFVEGMNRLLSI